MRGEQSAERKEKQEAAQFMAAWEMKPRRHKTKFQRSLYAGPTARRDAEEAERTRWIHELSLIVSGTPTPMGALLAEKPGSVSMLGAGLRASTLRCQSPIAKEVFLVASHFSHRVVYSLEIEHYTDYLKAKLSEPCNRGALKSTNAAFVFFNEVTGTPETQRPTSRELYRVVFRELLSTALPGRPAKQAPRMLVSMLEALETLVASSDVAPYLRVYGWWVLLQNWGTLRFSDHRGLNPAQVTVSAAEFQATLTRSKTVGSDKNIRFQTSRGVVLLLRERADVVADRLEAPVSDREISKETSFFPRRQATWRVVCKRNSGTTRVLPYLTDFSPPSHSEVMSGSRRRSPISGHRTHPELSLPSSTAALGFPQEERNFLGGWQAEARDRYARVAKLRVRNMQKAVVQTIQKNDRDDPLGEAETFTHLDEFMAQKSHSPEARAKLFSALEKWEDLEREAAAPEDEEVPSSDRIR